MNKNQLIRDVAMVTGKPLATVETIVDTLIEGISGALADGDSLMLRGFGTFEVRTRAARTARNPRTNEAVPVPATKSVKFRPSQMLKDRVAGDE